MFVLDTQMYMEGQPPVFRLEYFISPFSSITLNASFWHCINIKNTFAIAIKQNQYIHSVKLFNEILTNII